VSHLPSYYHFFFYFYHYPFLTDVYPLSLHDALPIFILLLHFLSLMLGSVLVLMLPLLVWLTPDLRIKKSLLKSGVNHTSRGSIRSEERFSRNAETDIVCRLLLVKKILLHKSTCLLII